MKTQDELKAHYRDVIIPMVAKYNFDHGTDVKPWKCVKTCGRCYFREHPNFNHVPEDYTFALTILEGKPVFVGDKIYSKSGETFDWDDKDYYRQITHPIGVWTWTPPPKKRMFVLNGVELSGLTRKQTNHFAEVNDEYFFFDSSAEFVLFRTTLQKILTEARDKE